MKIAVILTPDADGPTRVLGEQASESIREALLLKKNGRACKVIVVAIGQPLSEVQAAALIQQGVDYTWFHDCDQGLGAMELTELLVGIAQTEWPDLIFIGRDKKESRCPLGNLLAELLEFRLAQQRPGHGEYYRTLVIREIGHGMHRVRISLLPSQCMNSFGFQYGGGAVSCSSPERIA